MTMTCRSKSFDTWEVRIENGNVTLSGAVPAEMQKVAAYLNSTGFARRDPDFALSLFKGK
jgi:hypothetical protein